MYIFAYIIAALLTLAQYSYGTANTVKIAITLDDFPLLQGLLFTRVEVTKRLIAAARDTNCTLAFFCLGERGMHSINQQCLQEVSDNGHFLANHSMTHSFASAIPITQLRDEIMQVDTLLERYPMKRRWFRFPYLDYGFNAAKGGSLAKAEAIRTMIKQLGYTDGYVSLFTMDYHINAQLQKALKQNKKVDYAKLKEVYLALLAEWCHHYITEWRSAYEGAIVHTLLLHANELNALYLKDIIQFLQAEGWQIVSPPEAFENTPQLSIDEFPALRKAPTMNATAIDQRLAEAKVFSSHPVDTPELDFPANVTL